MTDQQEEEKSDLGAESRLAASDDMIDKKHEDDSPKTAEDIATEEMQMWLDHKRMSEAKREELKDNQETLIAEMAEGWLRLDQDTMELKQKLRFPLGESEDIKELHYRPRIKMGDLRPYLKNVGIQDIDERLYAYAACLSGKTKGVIRGMDPEDYRVAQAIAAFFG